MRTQVYTKMKNFFFKDLNTILWLEKARVMEQLWRNGEGERWERHSCSGLQQIWNPRGANSCTSRAWLKCTDYVHFRFPSLVFFNGFHSPKIYGRGTLTLYPFLTFQSVILLFQIFISYILYFYNTRTCVFYKYTKFQMVSWNLKMRSN